MATQKKDVEALLERVRSRPAVTMSKGWFVRQIEDLLEHWDETVYDAATRQLGHDPLSIDVRDRGVGYYRQGE